MNKLKYFVLVFFCLFACGLLGQKPDYSYMNKISNSYMLERDSNNYFTINKGIFEIRASSGFPGEGLSEHIKYSSSYFVRNDTLFIGSVGNQTKLKIISDGVLLALNDVSYYIKKGEKLYGNTYNCSINLLGGKWKNGLKQGSWFYVDESGKMSGIIFKDGVIIDTFKIKVMDPDF